MRISKVTILQDMGYRLASRRIFTEEDFKHLEKDMYEKYKHSVDYLLKLSAIIYCQHGLAQILEQDATANLTRRSTSIPRDLFDICIVEGFNLVSLVYALWDWMWSLCDGMYKNVLYIVGDSTTEADSFCRSILRLFRFVMTAHISEMNVEDLARVRETVSLLYFPPSICEYPFKNPVINTILAGHPVSVPVDGALTLIKPIKCIVRLKSLPKPDMMPTSHLQHTIIEFTSPNTQRMFKLKELYHYLEKVQAARRAVDMACSNPFGWLCTTNNVDTLCEACSQNNVDMIYSFAESG